jgi:ADP-heptose:LPS heptosyltransferase
VARRTGSHVVVAWGPGEEEIAGAVIASMETPATLAPLLSLGQLTALIRRCRVFIAGDTGPMHIAWTVGAPVVAVYGPTDPLTNRPGGPFSAVAYEKYFCSPCRNRGCVAVTCLERLRPEAVADAAVGVIAGAESAGGPMARHLTMEQGGGPPAGP